VLQVVYPHERVFLASYRNKMLHKYLSTEKKCPFEDIVEMGRFSKMVVMPVSDLDS
jgi:hypothetical protein